MGFRIHVLIAVYHILNNFLSVGTEARENKLWATSGFAPPLDFSEAALESECNHEDVTTYLKYLVKTFPNISRLVSIGNSNQERELWTIVISENQNERSLLKPQVKFVGNINGYSGPSCVILFKLIKFLLRNYYVDEELRRLVDSTEIHILPNMNPDGYANSVPGECYSNKGRFNAKGVDLNRNFPDIFHPMDDKEDDPVPEKETLAVMDWMKKNSFIVSASLISGAQVVSYPFDSTPVGYTLGRPHEVPGPDDKTFQFLARNYVGFVKEQTDIMWYCPSLRRIFPDGLINGAEWHSVPGTMMDFNYYCGTFEILVGLGCCQNDNNTYNLEQIWLNNKDAMMSIIRQAEYSFRGQVINYDTNLPLSGAKFMTRLPGDNVHSDEEDGRNIRMSFYSNSRGEFWRILVPGQYYLTVTLVGYEKQVIPFEINEDHPPELVIRLKPIPKGRRREDVRIIRSEIVQRRVVSSTQSTHNQILQEKGDESQQDDTIEAEQILHDDEKMLPNIYQQLQNKQQLNQGLTNTSAVHDSAFHELEPYPKALTEGHSGNSRVQIELLIIIYIIVFSIFFG